MNALFIVPAFCSPEVNEKIVPALAKVIERNILLNNSALFHNAAKLKYGGQYNRNFASKLFRRESSNDSNEQFFELYENGNLVDTVEKSKVKLEYLDSPCEVIYLNEFMGEHNQYFEIMQLLESNGSNDQAEIDRLNAELAARMAEFKQNDAQVKAHYEASMSAVQAAADTVDGIPDWAKNETKEFAMDKLKAAQATLAISSKKYSDSRQNTVEIGKNISELQKQKAQISQSSAQNAEQNKIKKQEHILNYMKFKKEMEAWSMDQKQKEMMIKKIEKELNDTVKQDIDKVNLKLLKANLKKFENFKKYGTAPEVDLGFRHDQRSQFISPDQVEVPREVKFFNQVSVEPTFLEIPIRWAKTPDPDSEYTAFLVKVGVKCVPYYIDSVKSILTLLNDSKNMGYFERLFKKAIRKVQVHKWFHLPVIGDFNKMRSRKINTGEDMHPEEAANMVKFSLNTDELKNPRKVADMFRETESSPWSTMIILSSVDFKNDKDLGDVLKFYKKMTKYVIGDLIITNETKESTYFCVVRTGSCMQLPFEYLKKVMNLQNVLDYSVISRQSRPFYKEANPSKANLLKAVSENAKPKKQSRQSIINEIIQS